MTTRTPESRLLIYDKCQRWNPSELGYPTYTGEVHDPSGLRSVSTATPLMIKSMSHSVNCKATESGLTSLAMTLSLHEDKSTLPVPCTMHLGWPVVPEL